MGSPRQHQEQQNEGVRQQLYGDRAYWQFVLHSNNDIVIIVVFGVLIIHLLATVALVIHTFSRGKVSQSVFCRVAYQFRGPCLLMQLLLCAAVRFCCVLQCSDKCKGSLMLACSYHISLSFTCFIIVPFTSAEKVIRPYLSVCLLTG